MVREKEVKKTINDNSLLWIGKVISYLVLTVRFREYDKVGWYEKVGRWHTTIDMEWASSRQPKATWKATGYDPSSPHPW
jgi:hypothetical protein